MNIIPKIIIFFLNFRRSYPLSKFSALISTERSDVGDNNEDDIYNLKQILQSRNNFYARMPRDSFQRTSRRLDHQTTHSVIPIEPLVPTFDISFEDWLGESGETPVTSREEFSYPQSVL